MAELLDCGHEESRHGPYTVGYGTDDTGRRACYGCCANEARQYLRDRGILTAYLSEDRKQITGWPGFPLLRVTRATEERRPIVAGRYVGPGVSLWRVGATDPSTGHEYSGRGPVPVMYITMGPIKGARCN